MTLTADRAATPVTPTDLLGRVRAEREVREAADARVLVLAVDWAHAHPALPGEEVPGDDPAHLDDPEEAEWWASPTTWSPASTSRSPTGPRAWAR